MRWAMVMAWVAIVMAIMSVAEHRRADAWQRLAESSANTKVTYEVHCVNADEIWLTPADGGCKQMFPTAALRAQQRGIALQSIRQAEGILISLQENPQ